jgi:four helix bundle protein
MVSSSFERLDVYRLSERLSDEIWRVVRSWPSSERRSIGDQLIRSADSIGANIAEGVGRWNFRDNKRCVRISRGSLFETRHWLRRASRRGLLSQEQITALSAIMNELIPKLNAYLNSIGRQYKPNTAGRADQSVANDNDVNTRSTQSSSSNG